MREAGDRSVLRGALGLKVLDDRGHVGLPLASAGRWESAVMVLIAALRARAAVVAVEERDELRRVLEAMDLPGARVEKLIVRPYLNTRLRSGHRQPPAG